MGGSYPGGVGGHVPGQGDSKGKGCRPAWPACVGSWKPTKVTKEGEGREGRRSPGGQGWGQAIMRKDLIARAVRSHLRICFSQGKERHICILQNDRSCGGERAMVRERQWGGRRRAEDGSRGKGLPGVEGAWPRLCTGVGLAPLRVSHILLLHSQGALREEPRGLPSSPRYAGRAETGAPGVQPDPQCLPLPPVGVSAG